MLISWSCAVGARLFNIRFSLPYSYLGMPYPQNLQTAKEVEAIIREQGATPATIAILDGVPCIGVLFCPFFPCSY